MAEHQHRVVATAGHVDHGKSTLVRALTGIDPDRLVEEQRRQMTIDLGFASFTLPSGQVVGLVDVPGHRDFVPNMLSGLGGINAVILVVAADEGVMPQTDEHIDILDLLEVGAGLVALTKADLVEPDWLEMVTEDVRARLEGTTMAGFPVLPVSGVSGLGIPEVVTRLDAILAGVPSAPDLGRARLPIDRAFTMRGHGTVVTGTLIGGRLRTGDVVKLLPTEATARVRSLQSHGTELTEALPGSRVAANLVGVSLEDVERGQVLTSGDWLRSTHLLDTRLRILPGASHSIEHAEELQLFCQAQEVPARVRVLEGEAVLPGDTAWVQLLADEPVTVTAGDHFVLRRPSPTETVGGGWVIDAHPQRRHRRGDPQVIERLAKLHCAEPTQRARMHLVAAGPQTPATLAHQLDITRAQASELLQGMASRHVAIHLAGAGEGATYADPEAWAALSAQVSTALDSYHQEWPLRPGMSKEELRLALRLRTAPFLAVVERWLGDGTIEAVGDRLRAPGWRVEVQGENAAVADEALGRLRATGANGLTVAEAALSDELLATLLAQGRAHRLPEDILLEGTAYAAALEALRRLIAARPDGFTVADARDALQSNRRTTLALLSELDDAGLTRRQGDVRVAGRRAWPTEIGRAAPVAPRPENP